MEIKYTKCPEPVKTPCLMTNEHGEIFFVTDGMDNEKYVTRIASGEENVETWQSDLRDYKPLPKGTKIEIVN